MLCAALRQRLKRLDGHSVKHCVPRRERHCCAMAKPPLIWLTRPQEDSQILAAELNAYTIESLIAPVMHIKQAEQFSPPTVRPDAILLTSRHAAHSLWHLPRHWQHVPVFCVGKATAEAASLIGYANLHHGEADVLELLPQLIAYLPPESRLLYLSGEETRVDVAALLAPKQILVEQHVAYQAAAAATLPAPLLETMRDGHITGAVFFSVRSALIAAQLVEASGYATQLTHTEAYCLSLGIAEAASALPWQRIHATHVPTTKAMVDLIVSRSTSLMV